MNGFNPAAQLRQEMDRLASDFFGPVAGTAPTRLAAPARGFPAVNVWEDGETLYAEAEVPGLTSEEIDIAVIGNELTIRGKRGQQQPEGVADHRQERGVGEFSRMLRLPVEIDANRVEASLTDGVLLVKLPKAESAKPKKIKVTSAK
jgi:HSP20 family protein